MTHQVSHETLTRYLDDELPREERARVERHMEACSECRREVEVFRALMDDLDQLPEDRRPDPEETMWDAIERRIARPLGWGLLVAGGVAWGGYAAYLFATSSAHLLEKLSVGAVVVGLLLLLISVGRQRYLEWQDDPYREVRR